VVSLKKTKSHIYSKTIDGLLFQHAADRGEDLKRVDELMYRYTVNKTATMKRCSVRRVFVGVLIQKQGEYRMKQWRFRRVCGHICRAVSIALNQI
jgi:hypothetical protein